MSTVLVIDDEREHVEALLALLSPRYSAIGATTARDALAVLGTRADHGGSIVDAVILDSGIGFPDFDLMAEVVKQGLLLPWIICSGRDEIPGAAINIPGLIGYVAKGAPDTGELLLHYVERALGCPPDYVARALTPIPLAPARPLSVLVVDDSPDICDVVSAILADEGFAVESITDPRLAMASIARSLPDVVLCDLMMPHLTGQALIAQIREEYGNDLAIVIMTAHGSPAAHRAVEELGVEGWIDKPMSVEVLTDTIRKAREAWLLTEESLARTPTGLRRSVEALYEAAYGTAAHG